jgi:hypothetical protein
MGMLVAEIADKVIKIWAPLCLNGELGDGLPQTGVEVLDHISSLVLIQSTQKGIIVSPGSVGIVTDGGASCVLDIFLSGRDNLLPGMLLIFNH